jgi:hypothetical protein
MMSRIQRFLAFGLLAASLHAAGLSKPPSIVFNRPSKEFPFPSLDKTPIK